MQMELKPLQLDEEQMPGNNVGGLSGNVCTIITISSSPPPKHARMCSKTRAVCKTRLLPGGYDIWLTKLIGFGMC